MVNINVVKLKEKLNLISCFTIDFFMVLVAALMQNFLQLEDLMFLETLLTCCKYLFDEGTCKCNE